MKSLFFSLDHKTLISPLVIQVWTYWDVFLYYLFFINWKKQNNQANIAWFISKRENEDLVRNIYKIIWINIQGVNFFGRRGIAPIRNCTHLFKNVLNLFVYIQLNFFLTIFSFLSDLSPLVDLIGIKPAPGDNESNFRKMGALPCGCNTKWTILFCYYQILRKISINDISRKSRSKDRAQRVDGQDKQEDDATEYERIKVW